MSFDEHVIQRIMPPPPGKLYYGVYPGQSNKSGLEDDFGPKEWHSHERTVGSPAAWLFFSNEWSHGRAFPLKMCEWIRASGSVPFIRLMLRDSTEESRPNKLYTLRNIIRGKFDADFKAWARHARAFRTPLLVEYGTECNGEWFPWNAKWNGADATVAPPERGVPNGAARFVAAYRHIVDVMRAEGAHNITWVFHVDAEDSPDTPWNRFESYYPGDAYVDWIGISSYGPLTPMDETAEMFREKVDPCYARIEKLTKDKPIIIAEFGCTAGNALVRPEVWADAALRDLFSDRWPRVIGFSWWNESWENDDNPSHDTTMRVQDIPQLAAVFRDHLQRNNACVLTRALLNTVMEDQPPS